MTRGPARRRSSPRRGRPETPAPQSFPDLARRPGTSGRTDGPAALVTVAGTLRANVTDGTGGRGSLPSSVVLVAEDGHTYTLELPPGWSVDAEAGARVEVSGELAGDGTLRVRRIATA